eukprot:4376932-Heterocapsa_arctica.AAC.1
MPVLAAAGSRSLSHSPFCRAQASPRSSPCVSSRTFRAAARCPSANSRSSPAGAAARQAARRRSLAV